MHQESCYFFKNVVHLVQTTRRSYYPRFTGEDGESPLVNLLTVRDAGYSAQVCQPQRLILFSL